jgi:serine/threonine-protein kinase RsbW
MIRLNVPSSIEYRDVAIRVIAAACRLVRTHRPNGATDVLHPDEEFENHVISAFGEAFNNAVLHGDSPASNLEVEVEPSPGRITIRLLDHGTPFDFGSVPKPDLDALPESGMGLYIIRSFMDDVSYSPGHPNVLTMFREHHRGNHR